MSDRVSEDDLHYAAAVDTIHEMSMVTHRAMARELIERRESDLIPEEHTVLGWIRGLAMTWNGKDADLGRAVIDKLCDASLRNLKARGIKP